MSGAHSQSECPSTTAKSLPEVVWLARHAETALPGVFHGAESDVELGEHGYRQAQAAAEWFATLKPTVVVSSALRRAFDTAAPIAAHCAVPHLVEPLLHERKVGALSRRSWQDADHIWNETIRRWMAGQTSYTQAGLESFDEIRARTVPAFRRIVAAHPGGRIIIISHGVVTKVLLLSLLRDHSAAHWNQIGRALNLATSELVPDDPAGEYWTARQLLIVPQPVLTVNQRRVDTLNQTEA